MPACWYSYYRASMPSELYKYWNNNSMNSILGRTITNCRHFWSKLTFKTSSASPFLLFMFLSVVYVGAVYTILSRVLRIWPNLDHASSEFDWSHRKWRICGTNMADSQHFQYVNNFRYFKEIYGMLTLVRTLNLVYPLICIILDHAYSDIHWSQNLEYQDGGQSAFPIHKQTS